MVRKVCFVTLSRSDYASLRPVIRTASEDPEIEVVVVAGGSHLLKRFGNSVEEIVDDGIEIDQFIDFLCEQDDTELDIARAYTRACQQFVEYFNTARPESVFILGDRWEMMAVASSASLLRIPIFHHSGGDITQGSLDNQTRYILSVLAHVHLVALDQHRQRLLSMGEEDWRIISVGEPALTDIGSQRRDTLRSELGLKSKSKFVLATLHPTTFDALGFSEQVAFFTSVLDLVELDIVLTAPNPDPGSKTFYQILHQYAQSHSRVHLFDNLGAECYHAAMWEAEYMLGNSSSGIWEAPSFGLPVINIGNRQQDRVRGENVIDVAFDLEAVRQAMGNLDAIKTRAAVQERQNPYVKYNTLQLINHTLKLDSSRDKLLAKVLIDPLTRH